MFSLRRVFKNDCSIFYIIFIYIIFILMFFILGIFLTWMHLKTMPGNYPDYVLVGDRFYVVTQWYVLVPELQVNPTTAWKYTWQTFYDERDDELFMAFNQEDWDRFNLHEFDYRLCLDPASISKNHEVIIAFPPKFRVTPYYTFTPYTLQVYPSVGMQILNAIFFRYPGFCFHNNWIDTITGLDLLRFIRYIWSFLFKGIYSCFTCFLLFNNYFNLVTAISWEMLILYNSFLFCILQLIYATTIRLKFFYFFLFLLLTVYWGFSFSFDGIMFILLLIELMLLFIFLLIFLNLSSKIFSVKVSLVTYIVSLLIANILFFISFAFETPTYYIKYFNYIEFTSYIISSDFFIFFYFFYILYPVIVIILAFILGLFSVFFIFIFFILKINIIKKTYIKHQLFILRKQSLTHQSKIQPSLKIFQK